MSPRGNFALVIAGAVFLWSLQPTERYDLTSEGKIIINHDLVAKRAAAAPFIGTVELLLGLLPEADLSYDRLQQHALYRCGTPGADSFSAYSQAGLRALTNAIVTDKPRLTNIGKWIAHENYVRALCTQLELSRLEIDQPEIFAAPVKAVIIAGPPRTGSTHLMSMLCAHPNATCLTLAETLDPIAPSWMLPSQLLSGFDYRLWKNLAVAWFISQLCPLFKSMQKFQATAPMEEIVLGATFFGSMVHFSAFPLPSYEEWFRETDHLEMELAIKKILQVIQHQRGAETKMWILKSPQNANQLGAKALAYPGSQFIFTHRKSFPVIQSWVGMLSYILGVHCDSAQVDYKKYVLDLVNHQQWSQERILPEEVSKHINTTTQLLNVYYDDFMKSPVDVGVLAAKHAGLLGGADIRKVFQDFQDNSPKGGSSVLKYDLESFGVTKELVDAKFAKYEAAYNLR